ncbi:MAG: DUF2846 domain-containing protein [Firmicutes bacterium]|nr:DUF2846 domain-containing protein [Bacillota bacterium]
MKVKILSILIFILAGIFFANAQDVITLKNGDEIKAKVTEISLTEIKYKRFDYLDGPSIVIPKAGVFAINYENGTRELFNTLEEKGNVSYSQASAVPAVLHIYRRNSHTGALVEYDLYVNDKSICRVKNKWKQSFDIYEEGVITLWASTEVRVELPIKIEPGKEYYIRCGISVGTFVGHPKLELVPEEIGKAEILALSGKKGPPGPPRPNAPRPSGPPRPGRR